MMAVKLDFEVTVVDGDRADFTVAGRFPPGSEKHPRRVLLTPWQGFPSIRRPMPSSLRCVLFDLECLRAVLHRTYRYAGFVGSVRKAKMSRTRPSPTALTRKRFVPLGTGRCSD